jgi:hypothetical protein
MKKMLLILFFAGYAFSHTWQDSVIERVGARSGYFWSIDTLRDSVFWTLESRYETSIGITTYTGKWKITHSLGSGTGEIFLGTITRFVPFVVDTSIYNGSKWQQVSVLKMVGDSAIYFELNYAATNTQTWTFLLPIQNALEVKNKICSRLKTINNSTLQGRFLLNGQKLSSQKTPHSLRIFYISFVKGL